MKAILAYHSIDSSGSPISVSREEFERHVTWFASGRVRVTTVDELLALPETADALAITFDDGLRSAGEIAAPLLASRGLPWTIFVASDHAGGTNAFERLQTPGIPTLPILGWDDLEKLSRPGTGLTLGSHTRTHRPLAGLSGEELADDILGAARCIEERTGRVPVGFAYPYGSVSAEAASVVRTGFAWGCTTELHVLGRTDDLACLPRLDMFYFRSRGRLETWGSARFTYYLRLRSHARRIRQRWTTGNHAS